MRLTSLLWHQLKESANVVESKNTALSVIVTCYVLLGILQAFQS